MSPRPYYVALIALFCTMGFGHPSPADVSLNLDDAELSALVTKLGTALEKQDAAQAQALFTQAARPEASTLVGTRRHDFPFRIRCDDLNKGMVVSHLRPGSQLHAHREPPL